MQNKLNESFIDSYCDEFTSEVSSKIFIEGKETISGKEILEATSSQQVNFFIIKFIFRQWKKEFQRLESPFFDYKRKEVRHAMSEFMNIVSQHIEVEKDRFESLLRRALKDGLYLVAKPSAYLERDFESHEITQINHNVIEETLKYLQIYEKEIQRVMDDLGDRSSQEVVEAVEKAFEEVDTSQELEVQCRLLSYSVEITPEQLFLSDEEEKEEEEKQEEEQGEEKEADQAHDFSEIVSEAPSEITLSTSTHSTTVQPSEREEKFHYEEAPSAKEGIVTEISSSDQRTFVSALFMGEEKEFNDCLGQLENLDSFDEAVAFLIKKYKKEWDMNSDQIKSFLKILLRWFRKNK